jgi:mannose-6-phosphate isomerase-like protein (cupin superfamily)
MKFRVWQMALAGAVAWLMPWVAPAEERGVEPTWLRRHVSRAQANPSPFTAPGAVYLALFGEGDREARIAKGVTRYGVLVVQPGASTPAVSWAGEEQAHVVLEGSGRLEYEGAGHPLRHQDFYYVAPGARCRIAASEGGVLRILVMGFRVPSGEVSQAGQSLQIANWSDVPLQVVGNHPPSTQYRLMMGDRNSKRDRIASAVTLTSLFIMEFAPGGTNAPHHHEDEEEIYLLLDGTGDMVAGGGMDGVEGRHPAQAGDAYFFRLNCTVGFYNAGPPSTAPARILAVRSRFPRRSR